jgi:DNA invertase Pin-like site-specific DNA recombinase
MLLGYARVSTEDQSLDLQLDALKRAGCEDVYRDVISGSKASRPGLENALSHLREGDTLVAWRMDRVFRNLKHMVELSAELERRGIHFQSLTEHIDTSTPAGKLVYHIFAAIGEFERDLIRERTNAGLAAARARGRKGGRKPAMSAKQIEMARSLYAEGSHRVDDICAMVHCSRTTFYRNIKMA